MGANNTFADRIKKGFYQETLTKTNHVALRLVKKYLLHVKNNLNERQIDSETFLLTHNMFLHEKSIRYETRTSTPVLQSEHFVI